MMRPTWKVSLSFFAVALLDFVVQAEVSPQEFAKTIDASTYVVNPSPLVSMSFAPSDVAGYAERANTYFDHDFSGPTAENAPNEQYLYALALWDGLGVEKDRDDALLYAMLSLDKGLGAAALICGHAFSGKAGVCVPKDEARSKAYYKQAFEWAQANAAKGDVLAEYILAQCYWLGWGVSEDTAQAVRWWNTAAQNGCVWALAHLAASFLNGDGIEKNVQLGKRLLQVVDANAANDALKSLANERNCFSDEREKEFLRAQKLLTGNWSYKIKALPWLYRAAKGGNAQAAAMVEERQMRRDMNQKACDLFVAERCGGKKK